MDKIKTLTFDEIMTEAARVESASPGRADNVILCYYDSRGVYWLYAMHAKNETVTFLYRSLRAYRWRTERSLQDFVVRNPQLRTEYDFARCRNEELSILEDMQNVFTAVPKYFACLNGVRLWMP